MKNENEIERPQPGNCRAGDDSTWQTRLRDERNEVLWRTVKLKKHMDDPEAKHNRMEWEMLQRQFCAMREYLQVLTDRCVYYGLIESGDLGIHY